MSQIVRVTREHFLSDVDLRKALGIPPTSIILKVERKTGTYKGRGVADQSIDLEGCLVTVFDPKETGNP